jgi:hypothetical protein
MKTIAILLLTSCLLTAQDSSTVAPSPWKHGLIGSVNVTQVAFRDWAQGGENAFAWALFLEGKSTFNSEKTEWITSYKFGFGNAEIGSQSARKTDDKIDLETVLTYKVGAYVNPFVSASVKTQFATGYTYDALGNATAISNFFDPAYLTQTAGVGYQPMPELKTRLGGALRETIADHFANRYTYTGTDSSKVKIEGGFESVTELGYTLMENVALTSKLEMFAALKQLDRVTLRFDNTISAKVNKYISVNINFVLLNQPDVSTRTQTKQTMAFGLSYSFL